MNEPTLVMRAAGAADREAIERRLLEAGLPLAGYADHLDDFRVAESDDGIVGTVAIERYGSLGLLRSVSVAQSARGRGLGAALVHDAVKLARRRGLASLYLLTTTAADWFPRFGFRVVPRGSLPAALGASEELRGACPDTAVCMALDLESYLPPPNLTLGP